MAGRPERVRVGALEITGPITVEELGDPEMNHDPTRVTDGIELNDDPILAARRGGYEVSAPSGIRWPPLKRSTAANIVTRPADPSPPHRSAVVHAYPRGENGFLFGLAGLDLLAANRW